MPVSSTTFPFSFFFYFRFPFLSSPSVHHCLDRYLHTLRVSPQWWGPPQPPEGEGPGCTGRGSPGGFQSGGRPACWSVAGAPGGTAAHWDPAADDMLYTHYRNCIAFNIHSTETGPKCWCALSASLPLYSRSLWVHFIFEEQSWTGTKLYTIQLGWTES